jgi:hypothetical protein
MHRRKPPGDLLQQQRRPLRLARPAPQCLGKGVPGGVFHREESPLREASALIHAHHVRVVHPAHLFYLMLSALQARARRRHPLVQDLKRRQPAVTRRILGKINVPPNALSKEAHNQIALREDGALLELMARFVHPNSP